MSDTSEDEAVVGSVKPLRRSTRAASSEPETAHKTPASAAASARRARVAKAPTSQESVAPASKPSTARRGTRTKAVNAAEADEDDPLDSFAPEVPAPAAAKVRRTTRSRIPVGAVKEEDTTPAVVPPSNDEHSAPARAVRGRKAASGAPPSSGATKSGTRSRAGTSTKKTSAETAGSGKSTPTTGEEEDGHADDKENTPEPDDLPPVVPAAKSKAKTAPASGSKVKATRSVAKTRGEAEEPAASSADAPVKGAQRVSRKRATTAGKA